MSTLKTIKIILLLLSAGLIIYLLWQNFSPMGQQTITYDFKENPFSDGFRPATRMQEISCEKGVCSQVIFDDPVYFDLLLPRKFQEVDVIITYKPAMGSLKWGMKVDDGWKYFEEPINIVDFSADGWIIGGVHHNLKRAQIENRQVEFVLSNPKIKANDKTLEIKQIKFHLKRDAWLKRALNRLRGTYAKISN